MPELKAPDLMEKIVSLCKRRGFIFPSSEIYGGISGFWDYGPMGSELKRNVKDLWWRSMVHQRDDVVGLDASIIMHPRIWHASGHVDTFSDPMCDCLLSKKRFRADQIEPLSGDAYTYSGARDVPTGREIGEAYSVLIPTGKHPGYARQVAVSFYKLRGLVDPELIGETVEAIENTTRYNPENGSLLTEPRPFNLMFRTHVGPVADEENLAYLRPETAQAIFAQFKSVLETSRQKVPFGIGQIGKAFRNEVTPRNFTFRSREFEQMELEFFIPPDDAVEIQHGEVARVGDEAWRGDPQPSWGWEVWHKYWLEQRLRFYESIGLPRTELVEYWQKPEELAHYARATVDILYRFPFGTQELEGVAARGDFDLVQHQKFSGKSMEVFDEELRSHWGKAGEERQRTWQARFLDSRVGALVKRGVALAEAESQAKRETAEYSAKLAKGAYIPHVIEPSAGVDRLVLALICQAYHEEATVDEKGKTEIRTVMRFHPRVAPIKVAVFPLLRNRPELVTKARLVRDLLRPHMTVFFDETGSIGRRYARQDEAGTPFGITIDFDTLGENPALKDTVTVRDRDTQAQVRIQIEEVLPWLRDRLS